MAQSNFTVRIEDELKAAFNEAAKANDRSGDELVRDFIRDYVLNQSPSVDHDSWFRGQVQTGLDSADAGRLIRGEDVEAEFSARRQATLRKINGSAA
ncbi:MAG: ribbon-helix-helix protein, CopG family [Asticcacaulis sp.]|nr:ribbon-helix-helix protein, CopG family [Asticcacaulis sp.]